MRRALHLLSVQPCDHVHVAMVDVHIDAHPSLVTPSAAVMVAMLLSNCIVLPRDIITIIVQYARASCMLLIGNTWQARGQDETWQEFEERSPRFTPFITVNLTSDHVPAGVDKMSR
jgi:hypothetical protein